MKLTKRVFKEDIDPDFFNDAVEQSKINKKNMEDVMKDRTIKLDGTDKEEKVSDKKAIEKAVKDTIGKDIKKGKFDLIESLLNEGYDFRVEDANFNVNVVDRKALAKLVEGLKALGINPFVKKSVKEGYKYNVVIKGIPQRKRVVEEKEDPEVTEIAKFLEEAIEGLKDDTAGEYRWHDLDSELAVVVGYEPGYGEEHRDDVIQAIDDPDYGLCAKIAESPSNYTYTDMEASNMPYNAKTGEVWDTDSSLSTDTDCNKLAKWFYSEYKKMKKGLESGKLVLEGCKEEVKEEAKGVKHNPKQEKKFALEEIENVCPKCGKTPCECKEVKEDLNSNPYKKVIGEYFDYSGDFEFLEVVSDVVDRIDDFGDEMGISEAIDSTLVYYSDQWKILEHYCTPEDANWDYAYEEFTNDLYGLCQHIIDKGLVEGLKEDTEVTIDKVEITEPKVEINKGNEHRHQELAKSLRGEDEIGLLNIEDEDDLDLDFEDEDEFFCTNVPAMVYSTANDDEDRIVLNDVKINTEEKPSKGGAFAFDDEDELITKDTKFDDEEEE